MSEEYKTSWKSNSKVRETPWGSEIIWPGLHSIVGKCLKILKGERTSLKFYRLKDEVLFLYSGKVLVTHGSEKTLSKPNLYPYLKSTLVPGEVIVLQSGCPYRIEALEDSEIIEIGSRSGDFVMIEDDYGRVSHEEKED